MTDAAEEVFADTGYWIAMHNTEDEWHRRAREVAASLVNERIVTSEMVLVEFLNFCSRSGAASRRLAALMVRRLWDAPDIEVIPQDSAQLKAAVQRYADRPDQRWSVTDCASFLIMEERGITDALAHDRDFVQAGFRALLREV
ncbi:MAG: PIN domain-containing protein [Chloroflexota bacterium]|nr:PIN domain-containing protein [Chloroflexota bacterium]MDE2960121.1 PIN domain-containing protein [Chloroflexota bacterium]